MFCQCDVLFQNPIMRLFPAWSDVRAVFMVLANETVHLEHGFCMVLKCGHFGR
jgi:hypothetical protein